MSNTSQSQTWPRGPRPYLALLGCFLLMFNSWGLVNAYGTFASYYMEVLMPGRDLLLLNLIGSTESFVVLLFSALVGRLLDAGYYRYLTGAGWILVSMGMFTLSLTTKKMAVTGLSYYEGNYGLIWLTQGFTTGLGMACFFVSSSQIVSTWFPNRRSFAIGIVACGASIAGVIYPVTTKALIGKYDFWLAALVLAAMISGTSLLSFLLAMPNPQQELRKVESWTSIRTWVDTHAFKDSSFRWFAGSVAFLFFGFYAVFFNLEEWAVVAGIGYKDRRLTTLSAHEMMEENEHNPKGMRTFYLLCIMNGASSLGRLSSAYLSDHYGALNVHCIVTAVSSLLILCLWTVSTTLSHALAFVILFGAVSGAVIGLPPASVAFILGPSSSKQAKLGQWTGLMYTCAAPFALVGPVIAGHLITKYDTYLSIQLWSGICLLLSAAAMALAIWSRREDDSLNMDGAKSGASSQRQLNVGTASEITPHQNSVCQINTQESENLTRPCSGVVVDWRA